jgi:hypothetical protein
MRNLEGFFINPFMDKRPSYDRKHRFSEDHIGRLTANNTTGTYTTMITATLAVHQAFFGRQTGLKIKDALKQQQTELVENLMQRFANRVSRLNNTLLAQEVDKQALYQQFFPQGVMEFTRHTNKSNAEVHMARIHTAVNANVAISGGAGVVAEFQQFRNDWTALRNLQLQLIGETETVRTTRQQAEEAWAKQLFDNLLAIASQHSGQPERLLDFFNQSILRTHRAEKQEEGVA